MIIQFLEGLRMFKRSIVVRSVGFREYKGGVKEILKQNIEKCWNGKYFQVSSGHFIEFYTRDFGFCCESLLKLGYKKEVKATLEYALNKFEKSGVRTSISPQGKAFDFPRPANDSLPYLLRSLYCLDNKSLVQKYKDLLEKEARKYCRRYIDKDTGAVVGRVSQMRDHAVLESSCYQNSMAGMTSVYLDKLGLENPLSEYDYKKIVMNLWNGKYFYDDICEKRYVSGDAQIFPFWCGVVKDKAIMKKAFESLQKAGLDKPFPLKYGSRKDPVRMIWQKMFAPNYETDSIWMHMGTLYLHQLKGINSKRFELMLERYKKTVLKHKTFLEVFDSSGEPYSNLLYITDEGMLWAANYLVLL